MQPRRIEILAFPGVQLLDVSGPLQVFATANDIAIKQGGDRPYLPVVVSTQTRVATSSGLDIGTDRLATRGAVDTLVIAGGPGSDVAASDEKVRSWLIRRARRARRIASVCTGAFILAEAGLLKGLRATTHWAYCDELSRRFPSIRVERDPIFVREGRVWTSAGVTSGIDLALALVEQDLGRKIALAVAQYLVVFLKRPGGQAQFSAALTLQEADDDAFGRLHGWMLANLSGDLSLGALASRCGMSERSFSRHYAAATGMTPAKGVEALRVDAARRLLVDTRLSVKRIARKCGFRSEETMRRSFQRIAGAPPSQVRARFGLDQVVSP
jgi:transcriptional regulator GlxA family with amidase domain